MKTLLRCRHAWILRQTFCCTLFFANARAATFDATIDSDYATGGNWSTLAAPTGTEAATIGNGGFVRSVLYSTATGFATTGNLILGTGAGSSGTLTLSGGAGTLGYGTINIGASSGTGSLVVNAGAVTSSGSINIATSGGLASSLTVNGGTFNSGDILVLPDANVTGTVTLGSGTVNLAKSLVFGGGGVTTTGGVGVFNLNGGILNVGAGTFGGTNTITRYSTAGLYSFNFNGGTLKTTAAAPSLLNNSGTGAGNITYNVQSGGAVFDTTGGDATAAATLVAAAGNGGLAKNGSNTLTFSGVASGNALNMTANNGTLRLTRAGLAYNNLGGSANSGALAVNSGATLQIGGAYNIGYQQAVNVNGGTLDLSQNVSGDGQNYTLNLNFTGGGSIVSTTGSSLRWGELANATITVNGTAPATISSILRMIPGSGRTGTIHVVDPAGNLAFTGNIIDYPGIPGGVPLIKTGNGTLTLAGTNTYTSTTTINGGTLRVNGSTGTSAVTVNSGGSLAGSGAIGGSVTVESGGSLSGTPAIAGAVTVKSGGAATPGGASIATLIVNNTLNLQSGSTTTMQIDKTGGVLTNDQLFVNTVNYGGTLAVTATGEALAPGNSFILFDALSHGSTNFTTYSLPALATGLSWDLSGLATTGSIMVVDTLPTPVFSPLAGGYIGAQNVSITCNEPGATIYYTFTTNGSTPPDPTISSSSGTVGSSTASVNVPVDSIKSIKAIAVKAGSANSPVAQADYATVVSPVWTLDGGGNWSDPLNWYRGAVAQGSGVPADFTTLTLTGPGAVTLDASRTIGSLNFGDVGAAFGWTLAATGGSALTLDNGGSVAVITVANQSASISAPLTGSQGLLKNGPGTLAISGSNNYGGTTVQNGVLIAGSANALPPGQPVAISAGATLDVSSTGLQLNYYKFVTSTTIGAGGQLTLAGAATEIHNLTLSGGTLAGSTPDANYGSWGFNTPTTVEPIVVTGGVTSTISALKFDSAWANALTFNVDAGSTLDVTGTIGGNTGHGTFPLVKNGDGTMILGGANSYAGATDVNGGKLVIDGTLAATAVTVATNTTLDAGSNLIGKAAMGASMSIASGGHLAIHIASAPASQVARTLAGNLTLTSGNLVDLSAAISPVDGTYILVTAASISGTPGVGTTLTLAPGRVATLSVSGGTDLVLTISSGGYDSWKSQITNGKTLRIEDADDDGFTNLQEFLFGTNPMAGTGPLTTTTTSGGVLTIRWRERVSGAIYQLLESATLANPWNLSGTAPGNDGPVDGDYQPRKAMITIGAGKDFFRVEGVEN